MENLENGLFVSPDLDQMIRHWMEVGPYASTDEFCFDAMLAIEDVSNVKTNLARMRPSSLATNAGKSDWLNTATIIVVPQRSF